MANFSIIAKLGMDSSKFRGALNKVGSGVKSTGKAIGGAISAGFAVAATAAAAFAVKGVSAFVEFEKKMGEVSTLLPNMTAEGFAKMESDLRKLAETMGVDLLDSTQALYNALSAGIPADNAVNFLATRQNFRLLALQICNRSLRADDSFGRLQHGRKRSHESLRRALCDNAKRQDDN